ncbi:MAG: isochorismatase family protein [Pseudomonadota bacterium]
MIPQQKHRPAPKVPEPHEQWAKLDLAEVLSYPTAYVAIGYSNSILSEQGAQAGERLWERGRMPGGTIWNTLKLVHTCREHDIRLFWTKYEIFRQKLPQTLIDKAQYDYWASHYPDWTVERIDKDWQPIEEIRAVMQPEDPVIHYTSLGNVFLGTMLPAYLNMWGIRTVLLSGFHLDWCIEQAARTCRDMGYMPIVVGDACGCGVEADELPTLQKLTKFFAPVVSTDEVIGLIQAAASRRARR